MNENHLSPGSRPTVSRAMSVPVTPQVMAERHQRALETLLVNRGIVSPDALKLALKSRKSRPEMKLGELLMAAHLVSSEQVNTALGLQTQDRSQRIGEILVEMGVITMRILQMALSDKCGIPLINVRDFQIESAALDLVDRDVAIQRQILPLIQIGESLIVAASNPLAEECIEDLRLPPGYTIVPVFANPDDLKRRIAKEYAFITIPLNDKMGAATSPIRSTQPILQRSSNLKESEEKPDSHETTSDSVQVSLNAASQVPPSSWTGS